MTSNSSSSKILLILLGYYAAWQTNLPGWGLDNWYLSSDHRMLEQLWRDIDIGKFGLKINTNKMHAIGFSSG